MKVFCLKKHNFVSDVMFAMWLINTNMWLRVWSQVMVKRLSLVEYQTSNTSRRNLTWCSNKSLLVFSEPFTFCCMQAHTNECVINKSFLVCHQFDFNSPEHKNICQSDDCLLFFHRHFVDFVRHWRKWWASAASLYIYMYIYIHIYI